jgi:hypothetical protein
MHSPSLVVELLELEEVECAGLFLEFVLALDLRRRQQKLRHSLGLSRSSLTP